MARGDIGVVKCFWAALNMLRHKLATSTTAIHRFFPTSPPAKIEAMFAIITVTGEDHTGIIAAVTTALAEQDVNIVDVSQTLMDKWFTMILRVEFNEKATPISTLQGYMDSVGKREGLVIRIQSEALFNAVNEI